MTSSGSNEAIVIVGAGIIGLNVALVLAEKGHGQSITVVAEHLPGDTSLTYTSPWAGCNFSAISGTDSNALRWDKTGYAHLWRLATECPEEAYVRRTTSVEFWDDDVPHEKIQHMSSYLKDFRVLPTSERPEGVKFAVSFTTITINAPEHIKYLHRRLQDHHGVKFVRRKLPSIYAAFARPSTKIVFNCTGLASHSLHGVEDKSCYPTRGQVVLVSAAQVQTNMMRHGKDYETYVIPRPGSNGKVVLGGYMQKGSSDGSTYASETESILRRAQSLSPELCRQQPEVLAAFAGLRPSRKGGARIERENIVIGKNQLPIVHNYGAGGTGFQAGFGMATEAVETIEDLLQKLHNSIDHARL